MSNDTLNTGENISPEASEVFTHIALVLLMAVFANVARETFNNHFMEEMLVLFALIFLVQIYKMGYKSIPKLTFGNRMWKFIMCTCAFPPLIVLIVGTIYNISKCLEQGGVFLLKGAQGVYSAIQRHYPR